MVRIAIVAPSCPLKREAAEEVMRIVTSRGDCDVMIHPQCFLSDGHFAGSDAERLSAVREVMADKSIDAIWFARGGYGSNRIAERAAANLPAPALDKSYLGYSDGGFLLAALHNAGATVAHGPMAQDVVRDGGREAVERALDWLVSKNASTLENDLQGPAFAFNLTVLSNLLGTPLEPDFARAELLIEDVSEHLYRIDRTMFHVAASANVRRVRQLRLGRVTDIPENDPDFGTDAEAIVRDWCDRAGIEFGGRADVGHDAQNKIVPFGQSGI